MCFDALVVSFFANSLDLPSWLGRSTYGRCDHTSLLARQRHHPPSALSPVHVSFTYGLRTCVLSVVG